MREGATCAILARWLRASTSGALALVASVSCSPARRSDSDDGANMVAAAFSEVARSLGPGAVTLGVTAPVSDATDLERRIADLIGAERGALDSVLQCDRVPAEAPERCRLLGADHFVEVPSIERKGRTGVVAIHVYEVSGGDLGEAVWKIEVVLVNGEWQFSRTIEIQFT